MTYLTAATWTGITKPTLYTQHDRQAELKTGTGWVSSENQNVDPNTLGPGNYGERTTEFEIYIACASNANNLLYEAEIESLINAKSVTGGWWEITEYLHDELKNRHDFHCRGMETKLS